VVVVVVVVCVVVVVVAVAVHVAVMFVIGSSSSGGNSISNNFHNKLSKHSKPLKQPHVVGMCSVLLLLSLLLFILQGNPA
jgi:hypothetical protein